MMNRDLSDIAASVSDRDEIDWQALTETTGDAATLANLRIVDLLARTLDRLDDQSVPDRWGALEVRSRIDSGACADVLLAYDEALDREVALKLFRQSGSPDNARLQREGKLLAKVDHPNVVRVHGAAQHDGITGIWMERVVGRSLHDIVASGQRFGAGEAAVVGLDVARGLAAIHGEGIVHGDIKAANVLRDNSGNIRIADFGAGFDTKSTDPVLRISGTPLYLAPELLDGGEPSVAADIYSLGVLLYFLVTGDYPVKADNIDRLRSAHAAGKPNLRDQRPDLDDGFLRIVEWCLEDHPDNRPRSAGALAKALSDRLASAAARPRRRYALGWIAATVALLVVLSSAWIMRAPGYSLDVEYFVTGAGQQATNIGDGASVSLGDRLEIELALDTPLHVYVFSESDDGASFGLFPLPELGLGNPVGPAGAHRLPGEGWSWLVSQPAGAESIHIVASPEPLPELAAAYAALPQAAPPGDFAPRGIGKVVRAPARDGPAMAADSLLQVIAAASRDKRRESGLTHRSITLYQRDEN